MAYTKQTWTDNVSQANASRLGYIETGIERAHVLLRRQPLALVAPSTAPQEWKDAADYVCTGTNDQNTINTALTATAGNGPGGVQLMGGLYYIGGSIIMRRAQTLNGVGMLTELRATSSFQAAMIKNNADGDNMLTISNLLVNGNFLGVHGIQILNGSTSFPQGSSTSDRPGTNPDSVHWIHHVYVRAPGNGSFSGHGIHLGTPSGSTGNCRGNKIHSCRVMDATGDAFRFTAASDSFVMDCLGTTRDGSGGVGYYVNGGSCKFTMCKTAYTNSHGFHILSSRAQLTGCSAQDSGGHGYYITSDAHLTGCQADSNGRLLSGGGDGFYIASSDVLIDGCRALDRNQSAQRQRHGFNYVSGTNVVIRGQAYNNTGNPLNNTAGFQVASNAAHVATDGSIYRWNH